MAFSLDQFYRLNRRALIWIILAVLLWMMRDFFALVFLTFILAFIATPMAAFAERRLLLPRRVAIIIVFGLFLIGLFSFVRFVTPSIGREAAEITRKLPDIENKILDVKNQLVANYPSLDGLLTDYMRSVLPEQELKKVDENLRAMNITPTSMAGVAAQSADSTHTLHGQGSLATSPTYQSGATVVQRSLEQDALLKTWLRLVTAKVREKVPEMLMLLTRLTGTLLLALLFSFLITLDITRLREELDSLRASRLHDFYEQTAQPVVRFAYVLGRSFQAQAAIACINALLTLLGLIVLGIPSLAVLTLIVFVCSFIPVLGVFISSTPIVLVALNTPGGMNKAVSAIVMIIVIHAIESYLLNPIIYGRHLKLNPVLVLLILFVGHHAFGLWGMLLGVPVAYYFIHDVFGVPVWGERRVRPRADAQLAAAAPAEGAAAPAAPATEPTAPVGAAKPGRRAK